MIRRIEQKKERRKKFLMGSVLVFLMIVSLLGVILSNNTGSTSVDYNGYQFTLENNVFKTKINGKEETFFFLPQSLETIKRPDDLKLILSSQEIKVTFNPTYTQQELTYIDLIRQDLNSNLAAVVQSGVTNQTTVYPFPIITCEDDGIILFFNESNKTSIDKKDNCIVLNAKGIEFLKIRDLLLYEYYNIMN